jgi:hypothetical protein
MTGLKHYAQLFSVEMGSLKLFFFFLPVLAWNYYPSELSLDQKLGITGVCLCALL